MRWPAASPCRCTAAPSPPRRCIRYLAVRAASRHVAALLSSHPQTHSTPLAQVATQPLALVSLPFDGTLGARRGFQARLCRRRLVLSIDDGLERACVPPSKVRPHAFIVNSSALVAFCLQAAAIAACCPSRALACRVAAPRHRCTFAAAAPHPLPRCARCVAPCGGPQLPPSDPQHPLEFAHEPRAPSYRRPLGPGLGAAASCRCRRPRSPHMARAAAVLLLYAPPVAARRGDEEKRRRGEDKRTRGEKRRGPERERRREEDGRRGERKEDKR